MTYNECDEWNRGKTLWTTGPCQRESRSQFWNPVFRHAAFAPVPTGPFEISLSEIDTQRTQHPSPCLRLQAAGLEPWLSFFFFFLQNSLQPENSVWWSPRGTNTTWDLLTIQGINLVSGLHRATHPEMLRWALIQASVCNWEDKSPP